MCLSHMGISVETLRATRGKTLPGLGSKSIPHGWDLLGDLGQRDLGAPGPKGWLSVPTGPCRVHGMWDSVILLRAAKSPSINKGLCHD